MEDYGSERNRMDEWQADWAHRIAVIAVAVVTAAGTIACCLIIAMVVLAAYIALF